MLAEHSYELWGKGDFEHHDLNQRIGHYILMTKSKILQTASKYYSKLVQTATVSSAVTCILALRPV